MLDDDLDQAIAQLNPDGLFFCKLFCKNPNLSTLEAKTAHTETVNKKLFKYICLRYNWPLQTHLRFRQQFPGIISKRREGPQVSVKKVRGNIIVTQGLSLRYFALREI